MNTLFGKSCITNEYYQIAFESPTLIEISSQLKIMENCDTYGTSKYS